MKVKQNLFSLAQMTTVYIVLNLDLLLHIELHMQKT